MPIRLNIVQLRIMLKLLESLTLSNTEPRGGRLETIAFSPSSLLVKSVYG
ncbi:hypothetical protein [Caldivirga sp.]